MNRSGTALLPIARMNAVDVSRDLLVVVDDVALEPGVIRFRATGSRPWVEVSCVKDYPGAWAEYRVYEGGIVQVFRRISAPDALVWSERTRDMYAGTYHDLCFGAVDERNFVFATS